MIIKRLYLAFLSLFLSCQMLVAQSDVEMNTFFPAPFGDFENLTSNTNNTLNTISNYDSNLQNPSIDQMRYINVNRGLRVFGDIVGPYGNSRMTNANSGAVITSNNLNYIELDARTPSLVLKNNNARTELEMVGSALQFQRNDQVLFELDDLGQGIFYNPLGVGAAPSVGNLVHMRHQSYPVVRLDTNGNQSADPTIIMNGNSASEGLQLWYDNTDHEVYVDSLYNNSDGHINFRTRTSGTPIHAMTVKANGYIGIGVENPSSILSIGNLNQGLAGTAGESQVRLSGPFNQGVNSQGTKLLIEGYDNDDQNYTFPIVARDENNRTDFYLRSRYTDNGSPLGYFDGNVEIDKQLTVNGVLIEPMPIGSVIMWYGNLNAIPAGWALCNGQNGTPDLRNRFVAGAGDQYQLGDRGGEDMVTLLESAMPRHSHGVTDPGHNHLPSGGASFLVHANGHHTTSGADGSKHEINNWFDHRNPHKQRLQTNTTGITINEAGDGQPHENRPPFYALYFIIKVAHNTADFHQGSTGAIILNAANSFQ